MGNDPSHPEAPALSAADVSINFPDDVSGRPSDGQPLVTDRPLLLGGVSTQPDRSARAPLLLAEPP